MPSDAAAALMGVSRTRLSQLTSAGYFSTEKRRTELGRRPRIYYKRSEILAYVQGQQRRVQGATAQRQPLPLVSQRDHGGAASFAPPEEPFLGTSSPSQKRSSLTFFKKMLHTQIPVSWPLKSARQTASQEESAHHLAKVLEVLQSGIAHLHALANEAQRRQIDLTEEIKKTHTQNTSSANICYSKIKILNEQFNRLRSDLRKTRHDVASPCPPVIAKKRRLPRSFKRCRFQIAK